MALCAQNPERIMGFPQETPCGMSSASQASNALSKRKSLLSELLLAGGGSRQVGSQGAPSCSEEDEGFSSDDDVDMEDAEDIDEDEEREEERGADGTRPIPVPSSENFLKQQREMLKRFVYLHQIEEMRRQCQAYFERKARWESESEQAPPPAVQPALASPGGSTAGIAQNQHHHHHHQHHNDAPRPGF